MMCCLTVLQYQARRMTRHTVVTRRSYYVLRSITKGRQFPGSEWPLEHGSRGSKARWVDFSGKIAGAGFASVAIFDHPANPRQTLMLR